MSLTLILHLCLIYLMSLCCLAKTAPTNINTDKSALLALKSSITFDPRGILASNWSVESDSVCSWIGVTCGKRHQRVTVLNLSNMGLEGTIPSDMGNLSFVVVLNIYNNSFRGHLPRELGRLRWLQELKLELNHFSGRLPSWLGELPQLRNLFFANNSFAGMIPSSIGNISKLERLDLEFNALEGSIPVSIYQCSKLQFLWLGHNKLSGELKKEIANLTMLKELWLTKNQFTGILPIEIGKLQNLMIIVIYDNQFMGSLPASIFNISTLRAVDLSYNNLVGNFPTQICDHSRNLEELYPAGNSFSGPLPSGLYKCLKLQKLDLNPNHFVGAIARAIGNLTQLTLLDMGENNLGGTIPSTIFNISTLSLLSLVDNRLSGTLPTDLFHKLTDLEILYLGGNELSGVLPESLSNASNLMHIDLSENYFTGAAPSSLDNLRKLIRLNLGRNNLSSSSANRQLSILESLTKCRRLREVSLVGNPMDGLLPESIGNMSKTFQGLFLNKCRIKGKIPTGIGNLSNLISLGLQENSLTGFIPSSLKGLRKLQGVSFSQNFLQGPIPEEICELNKHLFGLYLSVNQLSGRVPDCFRNLTSLRELQIASNRLTGSTPAGLWNLKDLLELNVSSNSLRGQLPPEIGNLKQMVLLDMSHNQFFGNIPPSMGGLQSLENLSFAHNRLTGSIPETFQSMLSLKFFDLSENNMSGTIPMFFQKLKDLRDFNVSFNDFKGKIPSEGAFENFTGESFMSNEKLCGAPRFHVRPCKTSSSYHRIKATRVLIFAISVVAPMLVGITFVIVFIRCRKKKKNTSASTSLEAIHRYEQITYQHLLEATEGFADSNLLGEGSFAYVYKGILSNGMNVAVKVFKTPLETTGRSFDTECQIIRQIRHRNLTQVISSCSNLDFKALILKYMPNGSLEKWLYSHNLFLNILQRLDIMIDVACALDYLHHGSEVPVVHCDLKPSNVLLDDDMVGHVSDFGIAKLLDEKDLEAHTKTLGTIGYVAPEYGSKGSITPSCDVYSYGIMLMETFTRRRPTDEMFVGDVSLKSWVNNSLPNDIDQVMDGNLLQEERDKSKIMEYVTSIMELAMQCSAESPKLRMNMSDVYAQLKKIRIRVCSGGRR